MLTKKELLAIPEEMPEGGHSKGPGWRYWAAAHTAYTTEGRDILVLDVWKDSRLICRYFADAVTGRHCGFGKKTGWHPKIRLNNLILLETGWTANDSFWYGQRVEIEYGDSWETAHGYLGTDPGCWENHQESDLYMQRTSSRLQREHEAATAAVSELPEGFFEWANDMGEYAVGTKMDGGVAYICTSCKAEWPRKAYYGRKEAKCPSCGRKLRTAREGAKDRRKCYLIARAADGSERWTMRQFLAVREWTGGEWRKRLWEEILAVNNKGESFGKLYYLEGGLGGAVYGTKKHCGQRFGRGILYPDFGGAEELMTGRQRHVLRALADAGLECNIDFAVITENNAYVEYLVKGGFRRLAAEAVDSYERVVHADGETMEECLLVSHDRAARLRQMDGGGFELAWLRYEQETGRKVPKETLDTAKRHRIDIRKNRYWEMLARIQSPQGFVNYLLKQAGISGKGTWEVAGDYADYVRMAEAQRLNLSSPIFYRPKDLEAAHAECVKAAHRQEAEEKEKRIMERFPGVQGVLAGLAEKYDYESGGFRIISPSRVMDILDEGRALGHCVDTTDRYFERIEQGVTYLVFLRRAENPGKPWYTLEIEPGGTVRQQRTTGNRQDKRDQEAYMPFIREWQRQLRDKLTKEDRELQERSSAIRVAEYRELREKKELVWHGYAKGTLLVDLLEADLVENAG